MPPVRGPVCKVGHQVIDTEVQSMMILFKHMFSLQFMDTLKPINAEQLIP